MRSISALFAIAMASLSAAGCTTKEALAAPPAAPVVVELFTSEGCSSCPPADRVLADVGARSNVITLGFHVDYWDQLGWKDPFSASTWTARQQAYASAQNAHGLYTPQMIVDGREEFVGSDRDHADAAIAAAGKKPKASVVVTKNGTTLHVAYGALPTSVPADVVIAFVDPHAVVDVPAGENAGRKLDHTAIVKSLKIAGNANANGGTVDVPLEASANGKRIVVFVQERASRAIVGAAVLP